MILNTSLDYLQCYSVYDTLDDKTPTTSIFTCEMNIFLGSIGSSSKIQGGILTK